MERWEYQTRFFVASTKEREIREFIKEEFHKKARRHSPEAMIPELNQLGDQGWEVIHMEPVARVGGKEDVMVADDSWSATYFCVLKRRKPGSYLPVMPLTANGKPAFAGESALLSTTTAAQSSSPIPHEDSEQRAPLPPELD